MEWSPPIGVSLDSRAVQTELQPEENQRGAIRVAASPPSHPSPMGEMDASRGATKMRQIKLLLKKNFFVSKRNIFATTVRRLQKTRKSGALRLQAVC